MRYYCHVCGYWWNTLDGDFLPPSADRVRTCPPCLRKDGLRYRNVAANITENIPEVA